MSTLKGGSFNCKMGRPRDEVRTAVRDIVTGHQLDFLLLQEAAPYADVLKTIGGYRLVLPVDKCGTAILVRNGVDASRATVRTLGTRGWLYRLRWHPRRAMPTALLDGWLRVASVHMVPAPDKSPARRTQYNIGAQEIVAWADAREGYAMLLGGDWQLPSVNRSEYGPQWIAGHTRMPLGIWHVPGRVDYALARRCLLTDVQALDEGGSDHDLILFTVHRAAKEAAA